MPKLSIVKVKLDREVNAYVVTCANTKEAVVIDPGLPTEKIAEQAKGLKVRYIVATHCHPGHVAGKDELKEVVGGETALHSADAKQFLRSADRYLVDGDELEFGEFKLTVMHTPGHTPGSVCFLVANHAFVGDTLLAGGIGKQTPERAPACPERPPSPRAGAPQAASSASGHRPPSSGAPAPEPELGGTGEAQRD